MTRDTQSKSSNKRSRKDEEVNKKKKRVANSDSDNNDGSDTETDEMDIHEYRKFISKIFPSKYLDKKIKSGEKLKQVASELSSEEEAEEEKPSKKSVKSKNKKNSNRKYVEEDEDEDEDEDENDDYEEEEWETDISEEEEPVRSSKKNKNKKKHSKSKKTKVVEESEESEEDDDDEDFVKSSKGKKLNIIFTIGGTAKEEDEWESEEEYDSDYEGYEDSDDATEDEDEEVSTDESSNDDDDEEQEEELSDEEEEELELMKRKRRSKKSSTSKKVDADNTISNKNETPNETLEQLRKILELNPKDKSIKKCIAVYEDEMEKSKIKIEKKNKKQKAKNMRIFRKSLRDKNTMNDFSFYEKLETEQQKKIIKELREINKITRIEKPYRMTLLESNIPVEFKSAAMKKINSLRYMEPGSGEFYKSKNWVDTFMRIPFNKNEGLPISIEDGVDKCHDFMENAQKTLDQAVYGLNDAKMQIMQMLGQLLTNPKAIGTAIAIHGPPGTGKTSLVKEGISKILNRPFAFIALGGATDSSFLEGHGYTYEGSTWGKIVQILIDSKCMNPVIYFDELDKISDTPRGEEIAGILTHLTDTTQNSQFHDKYFSEINFDLSKCLFIFSYNDETKVNPILKDRMYRIKTKGYISKEKTVIANNYLLPKIREQVRFNSDEITISNEVLGHIIDTHCNKEDGVRNLKRCLEIIYTKLNLYRLMKPGSNLFEGEMALKVEFPYNVTKVIVDKLIKRESDGLETWRSLYL